MWAPLRREACCEHPKMGSRAHCYCSFANQPRDDLARYITNSTDPLSRTTIDRIHIVVPSAAD